LVRIGEATLIRLPADIITERIGSYLVKYLFLSSNDFIPEDKYSRDEMLWYGEDAPEEPMSAFLYNHLESIRSYTRYADAINPTVMKNRKFDDVKRIMGCSSNNDSWFSDPVIRDVFLASPSKDVQNVVKGLFLRQLVDTEISCVGYGDFLVLSRIPIHPYEPLLYEHSSNYPEYADADSDSDSDSDEDDPGVVFQINDEVCWFICMLNYMIH